MLKRNEDLYSLIMLTLGLFTYALPYIIDLPLVAYFIYVPLLFVLSYSISMIAHNHQHVNMFHSRILNRIADFLITIPKGSGCSSGTYAHNFNHHVVHDDGEKDWMGSHLGNEHRGLKQYLVYFINCCKSMGEIFKTNENDPRCSKYMKRMQKEHLFLIVVLGIMLFLKPVVCLAVTLPVMVFNMFALVTSNFIQHIDCPKSDLYSSSRNFLGKTMNLICFNGGYHTAHHINPNCHWSDLPKLHEKNSEKIPNECNEESLAKYLLREIVPPIFLGGKIA